MSLKINIIQFTPYFPPHNWGLETVWKEIWKYWCENKLWSFINITTTFEQLNSLNKYENIIFKWKVIWYKLESYEVLVCPSIELINNFPIYKIWSKEYKLIVKYLKKKISDNKNSFRVITHTRFFLTSFLWGLFARKNDIKWIHIEHGSSYVKLSSKIKSYISIIYDKIIWKWIFKKADIILSISEACNKFIDNKFIKRDISVFYRWLDLSNIVIKKAWNIKFIFVWRLVHLKWVSDLIESYKKAWIKNELIIIWDWEEKNSLKSISKWFNINFLWYKDRKVIINYLSENNCILVNPSYQEWMPTTVIEWLSTWCVVVASNVWWTSEISDEKDLVLFEAWNIEELKEKLKSTVDNYNKLNWLSLKLINEKFNREINIYNLYHLVK